jgi:hypothetical protein
VNSLQFTVAPAESSESHQSSGKWKFPLLWASHVFTSLLASGRSPPLGFPMSSPVFWQVDVPFLWASHVFTSLLASASSGGRSLHLCFPCLHRSSGKWTFPSSGLPTSSPVFWQVLPAVDVLFLWVPMSSPVFWQVEDPLLWASPVFTSLLASAFNGGRSLPLGSHVFTRLLASGSTPRQGLPCLHRSSGKWKFPSSGLPMSSSFFWQVLPTVDVPFLWASHVFTSLVASASSGGHSLPLGLLCLHQSSGKFFLAVDVPFLWVSELSLSLSQNMSPLTPVQLLFSQENSLEAAFNLHFPLVLVTELRVRPNINPFVFCSRRAITYQNAGQNRKQII